MSDELLVATSGDVVTITISRPRVKNAVSVPVFEELRDVLRDISAEQRTRCVVLTGAGGDFAAGADLSRAGVTPDERRERHQMNTMRAIHESIQALADLPMPVVAKVRGVAVGAGMSLALACDFVLAADDARFGAVFAKRGLSLDCAASWLLPRLVGMHKAKEIALLGDIFGAAEALSIGLVNKVLPAADLDAAVDALATRLASGPTLALSLSKRLLNASYNFSLAEALEAEAMAQTVNGSSDDTAEGMRAFFEKRPPNFSGR